MVLGSWYFASGVRRPECDERSSSYVRAEPISWCAAVGLAMHQVPSIKHSSWIPAFAGMTDSHCRSPFCDLHFEF